MSEHAEDFVAASRRLHEVGLADQSLELRLVVRESEEPVFFPQVLAWKVVHGAVAVEQFVGLVVRFAARAIVAFVRTAIQIATRLEPRPQVERGAHVLGLRGADETVVLDVESLPQLPERGSDFVHIEVRVEHSFRATPRVDVNPPCLADGTVRQTHAEPSEPRAVVKSLRAAKPKRKC